MVGFKKRLEYMLKHNSFVYDCYKIVCGLGLRILGLFIKTDDKFVLFTAQAKRFNDSPKTIYLYMLEHGLTDKYHCVWAVDDPVKYNIPGNAEVIVMDTMQYFKTALKAKYWICSVNIERGLHFKKNKTVFLNTWHCVPTNYMGNAVGTRKDFDWRKTDFICYSGEYEKPIIIRDCVAFEKNLLPSGLPRNDELFHVDADLIKKKKEILGIPKDKKVILYAPTWRDSSDLGKNYDMSVPINWEVWRKTLADDFVLLIRTHPLTTKLLNVKFDDFIRNFSDYPDVNDLMIAADVMISDYSSIIFDYSILGRPIICFGYDYDEYVKHRGFYFDLDKEFPSGIVKKESDVLNLIQNMDYQEECQKTTAMKNKFVKYGGHATEQCVEALFGYKN